MISGEIENVVDSVESLSKDYEEISKISKSSVLLVFSCGFFIGALFSTCIFIFVQ